MDLHLSSLHEPYAAALTQAVDYIIERYDPLGIIASGSVLRGEGDATSDLDLYVIHEQPWRQRVQRFFNGVPAEIFVNPPGTIRGYFLEERREGRFITAHMLATGIVVLNRDDVVDLLRAEAAEALCQLPDLSAQALTMARYMAVTALEDAFDIRHKDPANAAFILEHAMFLMVQYLFAAANRPLPRFKRILDGLSGVDPILGEMAHRFYTTGEASIRFDVAASFAQRGLGSVGFFEWETEPNQV
jgi:predicted nucleotidyltransferase